MVSLSCTRGKVVHYSGQIPLQCLECVIEPMAFQYRRETILFTRPQCGFEYSIEGSTLPVLRIENLRVDLTTARCDVQGNLVLDVAFLRIVDIFRDSLSVCFFFVV